MNECDGQPLGECPEIPAHIFHMQRIIAALQWKPGETNKK